MSEGGIIRFNSTTIVEAAALAACKTDWVHGDFESLLRNVELLRGDTPLPRGEKVPSDAKDLVIRVKVTLSPLAPSFFEVARRIQENVFRTVQARIGIVPKKVDVEVENVEWSELGERG